MNHNHQQLVDYSMKQQGAALVALIFMIGLVFMAYVLNTYRPLSIDAERNKQTAQALMEAKAALIGWSVKNNEAPGRLPCPEDTSKIGTEQEGQAPGNCSLPAIGRLPFKTLGVGDLRDGNKDRLWYVISDGFRDTPINSETLAQLTVDGVTNNAVAIVFSPGTPIGTQQRTVPTSTTPPNVSDYLDLTNNDGDNIFVTSSSAADFNDRLQTISHQDLFLSVEKRVLRDVKSCLDIYAANSNNKYPWATPVNTASSTYTGAEGVTFGRIPVNITTTVTVLGIPFSDSQMQTNWSAGCIFTSTPAPTYWHNNHWQELIFYQLAYGYRPRLLMSPSCSGTCLSVTGSGNPHSGSGSYRAVLIMARDPIGTQDRDDTKITNKYLEGINIHFTPNPSTTFVTYQPSDNQYANVNDLVMCIDGNNNCK